MRVQVQAMLGFHRLGIPTVDYGNNIRQVAQVMKAWLDAFRLSPVSFPPTSGHCSACGKGPFRWVALSGDPEDIRVTDEIVAELQCRTIRQPAPLAGTCRCAHSVSGPACAYLLAGPGRSASGGARVQRTGAQRPCEGTDRDWP